MNKKEQTINNTILSKLLYKLFKRQFLKYYFLEQSSKKGFEKMVKRFVDSEGRIYYSPENDFDTPLERIKAIEICVRQLSAGLSDSEMKKIREAMKKALNEGRKPDLARIGHLVIEMEKREEMVLHPEVMFDLVANKYIREDEDPFIIDKKIHQEKIEQFKKDSVDGLYDFFYRASLAQYIPYLTKLESEWSEYWKESEVKVKALNKQMNDYIFVESLQPK
jgi:hypothetical protein